MRENIKKANHSIIFGEISDRQTKMYSPKLYHKY